MQRLGGFPYQFRAIKAGIVEIKFPVERCANPLGGQMGYV